MNQITSTNLILKLYSSDGLILKLENIDSMTLEMINLMKRMRNFHLWKLLRELKLAQELRTVTLT